MELLLLEKIATLVNLFHTLGNSAMKTLGLFSLAVVLLQSVSCSSFFGNKAHDNNGSVTAPTYSILPPVDYQLEDNNCQKTDEEIPLQSTGVHRWEGLNVTSDLAQLDHTKTEADGSLASNSISLTIYGQVYNRDCDGDLYKEYGCVIPGTNQPATKYYPDNTKGGSLRVCQDAHQYRRETYEAVALTSVNYLNEARKQYELVGGQAMPRPILQTLPTIKDTLKDFQPDANSPKGDAIYYQVHNASYAMDEKKNEYFFIFPETSDTASLGFVPKGNLWESAFVLSHEFGHQIENHLWGPTLGRLGLRREPFLHKLVPTQIDLNHSTLSGPAGPQGSKQVFGAFSEGFADLAGLYALHGSVETLVGIECLGANRNPLNDRYHDGTPKELTVDVAETLLSSNENSDQPVQGDRLASCDVPKFQDIHVVGAILAYYINATLSAAVAWSEGVPESDIAALNEDSYFERYRLLINSVRHLDKIVVNYPQTNQSQQFEYFVRAIEQGVNTYIASKPAVVGGIAKTDLQSRLCLLSKETLPVLRYVPFSNSTGQCANIAP